MNEKKFDGFFETSAKEGTNITVLAEAIKTAVDWKLQPKVTSTSLFQHIKTFLMREKEGEQLLTTSRDLYQTFIRFDDSLIPIKDGYTQFEDTIKK